MPPLESITGAIDLVIRYGGLAVLAAVLIIALWGVIKSKPLWISYREHQDRVAVIEKNAQEWKEVSEKRVELLKEALETNTAQFDVIVRLNQELQEYKAKMDWDSARRKAKDL